MIFDMYYNSLYLLPLFKILSCFFTIEINLSLLFVQKDIDDLSTELTIIHSLSFGIYIWHCVFLTVSSVTVAVSIFSILEKGTKSKTKWAVTHYFQFVFMDIHTYAF